jgi:hypothetical protein
MAVKFDIKDGKLTISAETLSVSAFLDIWDHDKNRDKKKALALLKHVMHLCDMTSNNPLIDISYKDRPAMSRRDCFKDQHYKLTKEEQKLFDNAAAWYIAINKTLPWRSLRVVDNKIDQLNDHLDANAVTTANFEDQMKSIIQVDKLHASRERLEEIVERQLKKTKVRGGLERSPLETGKLNLR